MSMPYRTYNITGGTINGKTCVTCQEIATYCGLSRATIYSRLNRKNFDITALTKPVRTHKKAMRNSNLSETTSAKGLPQSTNKILLNKPFYGPLFRFMLKSISVKQYD